MITTILLIGLLFIFWFLNKKSINHYFFNSYDKLISDYKIIKLLYDNFQIDFKTFDIAWNYFKLRPHHYNGTSIINDRWFIKGLEPLSVEHDYEWIFAKSFKDLHKSNLKYCINLRKVNANFLWVWGFIFIGLSIVSIFKSIKYINFKK